MSEKLVYAFDVDESGSKYALYFDDPVDALNEYNSTAYVVGELREYAYTGDVKVTVSKPRVKVTYIKEEDKTSE